MKSLKNVIAIFLMVCFSVLFAGCTPNKPYIPSKPREPEGPTTIPTLEAVSKVMIDKLTGGEYALENRNYFSIDNNGEYYYDTYVYAAISILTEITKIENIAEDTLYSGETVTLTSSEIEELRFDPNYANKIEALYIENDTDGDVTELKIYVLGSRATYASNKYNAILFAYDIYYNSKTGQSKLKFNISKTTSNISDGYVGTLFSFAYDTNFGLIECNKFEKKRHFITDSETNNNISNDILLNINLYSQIYFFTSSGTEEQLPSGLTDDSVQETILQTISDSDKAYEEIYKIIEDSKADNQGQPESQNDGEESEQVVTLPSSLIYIINANKIEDFEDKLYGASSEETGDDTVSQQE